MPLARGASAIQPWVPIAAVEPASGGRGGAEVHVGGRFEDLLERRGARAKVVLVFGGLHGGDEAAFGFGGGESAAQPDAVDGAASRL